MNSSPAVAAPIAPKQSPFPATLDADIAAMAIEKIEELRAEKNSLIEALRCIAYEPFGDPEATDREVLEAITAFARANLPK
jgi:hypothetical protein